MRLSGPGGVVAGLGGAQPAGAVPVIRAPEVSRPAMAAQSRGPVKVAARSQKGGLAGTLMPDWWQGAVRTGRSHGRARSYQDRLTWARRSR